MELEDDFDEDEEIKRSLVVRGRCDLLPERFG